MRKIFKLGLVVAAVVGAYRVGRGAGVDHAVSELTTIDPEASLRLRQLLNAEEEPDAARWHAHSVTPPAKQDDLKDQG